MLQPVQAACLVHKLQEVGLVQVCGPLADEHSIEFPVDVCANISHIFPVLFESNASRVVARLRDVESRGDVTESRVTSPRTGALVRKQCVCIYIASRISAKWRKIHFYET